MADRVAESGTWASSDVVEVLQANGVLPSNANEATPATNMIGALAYAKNIGYTKPQHKTKRV